MPSGDDDGSAAQLQPGREGSRSGYVDPRPPRGQSRSSHQSPAREGTRSRSVRRRDVRMKRARRQRSPSSDSPEDASRDRRKKHQQRSHTRGRRRASSTCSSSQSRSSSVKRPSRKRRRQHRETSSRRLDRSGSRRNERSTRRQRRLSSVSESDHSTRKKKRCHSSDNTGKVNLTANDIIELIRSMPSSSQQQQNHFSMSANALPEFDPTNKEQTVDNWINKVEECSKLYQWNETQLLHYALPKLTGVAKIWYQGLPSLSYSWSEWKEKLIKTFPTVQNYAQLLHEMLDRKVRFNESVETYFYHKLNLLNRCEITGKKAVDCIIYGLEDRGLRMGAQAVNYTVPEDLLGYLKSVKTDDLLRQPRFNNFKRRTDLQSNANSTPIKCFNCDELGHPSFKCSKPLVTCNICKKLGHQSNSCRRINKKYDDNKTNEKKTSEVKLVGTPDEKYVLPITVNGISKHCYVDLGSQSTLMRLSDFNELGLQYNNIDLPILKGFGSSLIKPVGKSLLKLVVQGVSADVEVLIVEDSLLKYPVLLGHTFTEQSGVVIIKTDKHLRLHKQIDNAADYENTVNKIKLIVSENTTIPSIAAVPVQCETKITSDILINESLRCIRNLKYYVLPGIYSLNDGKGCVLIVNLGNETISLEKDTLLTRACTVNDKELTINKIESIEDPFCEQIKTDTELSSTDRDKLEVLLRKYRQCFSFGLTDLGLTNLSQMTITLKDSIPVVYRPYRMAHSERQKVKDMIKEMLDCGIVTESTSAYASPILLVQKKTGDQRLCIDYRALNAKTIKEHYPLPLVEDQIDCLGGHEYFITLDLASGYYQIPVAPDSQDKTAFVTPDGQYQFTRMPFGLANAPSVFQKTINTMLKDVPNGVAYAFMDDIIIPANSVSEGMIKLETVLKLLEKSGLTLKLSKCKFFFKNIDYLGFEVSKEGVKPGSRKTEAVEKFKTPENQHEIRQFLGLASFFRRFVKGFAIIANPLTRLLKKDTKFEWGPDQQNAFDTLKIELTKRPILALYDPKAKTYLHTDASKMGIAGILLQEDHEGRLRAISYYSRQTTPEEQKYHSFELETLAVIASLNRFRVYLLGVPFTIVTDCNALRTTLSKKDMIPRISRWWLQLQEYNCEIEYRPGSRMTHVDALSRNAIPSDDEPQTVFDVCNIETEDWLATMQSIDEDILRIKRILEDPETNNVVDAHKNYKIKNGKLYRIVGDELKWVVPRGFRWQLLQKNHDELGHFGVDKTLDKIKSLYWFPKMNKFVKKYVQSCLECSYHKLPTGHKEGMLHPIPKIEEPFHTIHMDHLGPFVKSKSKNMYILVIIDAYTKYINLYAVKNTKTKTTLKILNQYFSLFGIPTRLISDRGTSFTSKNFKDFVSKLGIRHVLNAVATPRANGQVERYNRTILSSLATKNHNCQENEWDTHLEEIQLGLNTTINKGTGKSPSEVLFGFRLRTKGDGLVSSLLENEVNREPIDDVRQEVNQNIAKEQNKQKARFDKKRKESTKYKIGDLVRIERDVTSNNGKSRKLLQKIQGPYRVIKVLDNDRYIVEDTPLTRKQNRRYEGVIAVDKMFPWLAFTENFSSDENSN
ncbi:hypothetical protein JYU34_005450 [Plutella xylostella]|uniref:RNA-directed DNA polymerase n=1 Tax=Plutella xylostella TaxID=51655 RepID=A0ABQ7QWP8_PLUXY|nr:hypothetical protein JYU34_005450 [Plutella xylostella]